MMRKFIIAIFLTALIAVGALGQTQSAPTLRIVTEDPNLPSDLFYGDIKVRPLRLRPGTNQLITIDDSDFFVQQHYIDFLNRFPETAGFNYWTNILNGCGSDATCINKVRVEISSRFFIELEFQRTGFLVMRLYKASYGTAPNFQQFITDRKQIQDTPASQKAFASAWVNRSAFTTEYPTSLSPSQFVQKLYDKAGIADAAARAAAVQKLTTDPNSRDAVIFDLVELASFQSREYNPAFVKMQYFGYLRRDADPVGEAFWNNVLASHPDNYQSMICAFVNSSEYQLRFNSTRGRFTELNCNW
jgi:hypothetical protein